MWRPHCGVTYFKGQGHDLYVANFDEQDISKNLPKTEIPLAWVEICKHSYHM